MLTNEWYSSIVFDVCKQIMNDDLIELSLKYNSYETTKYTSELLEAYVGMNNSCFTDIRDMICALCIEEDGDIQNSTFFKHLCLHQLKTIPKELVSMIIDYIGDDVIQVCDDGRKRLIRYYLTKHIPSNAEIVMEYVLDFCFSVFAGNESIVNEPKSITPPKILIVGPLPQIYEVICSLAIEDDAIEIVIGGEQRLWCWRNVNAFNITVWVDKRTILSFNLSRNESKDNISRLPSVPNELAILAVTSA